MGGRRKSLAELLRRVLHYVPAPSAQIPHVQGVLRYAYSLSILESSVSATDDGRLKKEGEGATFAAAMLPLLHACSAADAAIVQSNMAPGASMSMDRDAVKAALERNYLCMGIVCADVGALTEAGGCVSSLVKQGRRATDFFLLPSLATAGAQG